ESKEAQEIAVKYMSPSKPSPALTKEEADSIAIKSDAISKYFEENITKFILGSRPLSEWDDYVSGLKKLGVEDVVKVRQKAYDRQQAALTQK
ncbi:MAG: ABC transporter substrate-binding protein, partial [Paenibacillaceae bacterium]|nr:ABC transporter substrate-binding protein [Paenibacillaceae bacterium]